MEKSIIFEKIIVLSLPIVMDMILFSLIRVGKVRPKFPIRYLQLVQTRERLKKTLFQKILIILISWWDCQVSDLKPSVALRYWVGNKEWRGMNFIVLEALAYMAFLCTYVDRFGFQMSCGQLSIARPEAPSSLSLMEWCIKFLQRPSVL